MKYGKNGNMWITWLIEEEKAKTVFNLVLGSTSMEDVESRLTKAGYEKVGHGGKSVTMAHNNGSLVEFYIFRHSELSVSIKQHGFDNVKKLTNFWSSLGELAMEFS